MIRTAEIKDKNRIQYLLNKYLSYGLATDDVVDDYLKNYIILVYIQNDVIVGLITAKMSSINDFNVTINNFVESSYTIHHLVVDDAYRNNGIATILVDILLNEYIKEQTVYAIGWVKSDSKKCDARKICKDKGFQEKEYISNYFSLQEPVYCPICKGNCFCDGVIFQKN